jgi:hypothetical protein
MGGDLFERHQHEPALVHERMGEDQRCPRPVEHRPVQDAAAVVEEVEIQGASAPPRSRSPPGTTLNRLEKAQEATNW